jgi:hypothetical protein
VAYTIHQNNEINNNNNNIIIIIIIITITLPMRRHSAVVGQCHRRGGSEQRQRVGFARRRTPVTALIGHAVIREQHEQCRPDRFFSISRSISIDIVGYKNTR